MDSYTSLLERTRVPQPSLQKYAVISLFEKLRSAPPDVGPDSNPGRHAITYCIAATSPAVVDQAVRELCRLVKDSKLDLSRGLVEIQSALEGSDPRFVNLFVKAIGFLVRLGFQRDSHSFQFLSSELHPFVKVLSGRGVEVQQELVQQVVIFMRENKQQGLLQICQFIRPLLNYSIIRIPVSPTFPNFVRSLVSSIASLCSSFTAEAIPVLNLLIGCVKFFPSQTVEDFPVILHFIECIVDTYVVVLKQMVELRLLPQEIQLCGVEIVKVIFSLDKDFRLHFGGSENLLILAKHLVILHKEQGLSYATGASHIMLSIFLPLIRSKLEHEQLLILKMVLFLLEWKHETGSYVGRDASEFGMELLFIFPVINIVSSPCKHVKQAAVNVLSFLEKIMTDLFDSSKIESAPRQRIIPISRPESMIYRFLQNLWFQGHLSMPISYLSYASKEVHIGDGNSGPISSISMLKGYYLQIVEERKSFRLRTHYILSEDMSLILGAITCVILFDRNLVDSLVDFLAVIVSTVPCLGIPLLLLILFYNHAFYAKDKDGDFRGILLKMLALVPSLASHPAMLPLLTQALLPMLQRDTKAVLYATATRLVCKTWEINDLAFPSLQELLLPKKFENFSSSKDICISMAASIRDVCKRSPDRGVDLVLSVASCIENHCPQVRCLGLQSLAHLCEADVIDFYTAWDVISKHASTCRTDAAAAKSLCLLLRWGAMDAEVYVEASVNILKLLWEVGTSKHAASGSLWSKARAAAFTSLCHFEVEHILRSIPDFRKASIELLLSETDPEVLSVLEEFESRIMKDEHVNRRRFVQQKRDPKNKIEKLLDVFPRVLFSAGNENMVRELPGVALLSFAPKYNENGGVLKDLEEVNAKFQNALLEIASSLQLSRNILISLISLQSWKPFMQRWMKIKLALVDAKGHSTKFDKTSESASNILKSIQEIAEGSIPRSAENLALAIAALCLVAPTAHAVKFAASKFLLEWLFQYEHEYRQWSGAISIGLICSCLHPTDSQQKHEIINALLEVAGRSKSTLVKGACGLGLGLSCQNLLKGVYSEGNSASQRDIGHVDEAQIVRKIFGALFGMICQHTQSSVDILKKVQSCILLGRDEFDPNICANELVNENYAELDEDIWGIAGLALGLGISVSAIYRAGGKDAALNLKAWIFSYISVDASIHKFTGSGKHEMGLSVGSCIALPIVVAFCQQVELIDDIEVYNVVNALTKLISALVSVERSGTLFHNLLMAACTGAGNLLSCVLGSGLYSLKVGVVKDMLAMVRKSYSCTHSPFVHFGGMLGVVNALGANAGILQSWTSTMPEVAFDQKVKRESSHVVGPLLQNSVLGPELTSLIQDIFLVAKNSDDQQMQHFAAWALSFLRYCHEEMTFQKDILPIGFSSQSFSEDSVVLKLSLWLMGLSAESGLAPDVNTVASVLRCLSNAARLPMLDWRAIIQRCMRYEDQFSRLFPVSSNKKGVLREECLLFSFRHANQFDSLLCFLEELADPSRFRTLEMNLQLCMILHLPGLVKIFSVSRVCRLFDDIASFLSSSVLSDNYTSTEMISLRVSCWKGLSFTLDTLSVDTPKYMFNMENCMEILFQLLPPFGAAGGIYYDNSREWSEAIKCLGKARQSWLLGLSEISDANLNEDNGHFKLVRKMQAKARLVQIGAIPLDELGKLKVYMLNTRSPVIWNALVEVAGTLQHADFSIKRQWLLDTLEIGCVTNYPSTATKEWIQPLKIIPDYISCNNSVFPRIEYTSIIYFNLKKGQQRLSPDPRLVHFLSSRQLVLMQLIFLAVPVMEMPIYGR